MPVTFDPEKFARVKAGVSPIIKFDPEKFARIKETKPTFDPKKLAKQWEKLAIPPEAIGRSMLPTKEIEPSRMLTWTVPKPSPVTVESMTKWMEDLPKRYYPPKLMETPTKEELRKLEEIRYPTPIEAERIRKPPTIFEPREPAITTQFAYKFGRELNLLSGAVLAGVTRGYFETIAPILKPAYKKAGLESLAVGLESD